MDNRVKTIGLLGGSFDPMHFGHINLGLEMQEKHNLDEIIICPTAISPFKKKDAPFASDAQRFQMACLAIENLKTWKVIDWELKRGGVSYTIDTVLELQRQAETNKEQIALYLLLGQDILWDLSAWKDVKNLLTLAPPLIGVRDPEEKSVQLPPPILKMCQDGMTQTRIFEISSTSVRDRLKKRIYCEHLVPAKILDFIYHHQLYLH